MLNQWFTHFIFIILASTLSIGSYAQSAQQQRAILANHERTLGDLQSRHQQIQNEIEQKKTELSQLDDSDSPEKQQMDEAKKNLDEATATYNADPSATNESRMKNLEFKYALSERKYKKAHEQLFSLQADLEQLDERLSATSAEITQANNAISAQRIAIEKAVAAEASAAARSNAQVAEEQRMEREAAEAEILRLRAELAEKERLEQERLAQLEEAKKQAEQAQLQAQAAAEQGSVETQTESATQSPSAVAAAPAEQAPPYVFLLDTAQAVQQEKQRLSEVLAKPGRKVVNQPSKVLTVKAATSNSRGRVNQLKPLGHGQYQATVKLSPGDTIFAIANTTWQQVLPAAQGRNYIVTYDNFDPANPKLILFHKSLD